MMKENTHRRYKNIVFDLGQVLLPIDFDAPVRAFTSLGLKDFDTLYHESVQADLFNLLETGKITEERFRDELRRISGMPWTDTKIDEAWNTIILEFRPATIEMLKSLSKVYRLFLLSNTNSIHYRCYNQQIKQKFCPDGISAFFEHMFLSHQMGARKPEPEIFLSMQKQTGMVPAQTLFIDDNAKNIKTAQSLGYHTLHLRDGMKVEEKRFCADL
ncbi:MAG: HAD family phosphatase [Candidatus Delongbacteria bacterium]|jgi:HAD superfamily hydrolase (TIGR01549 family)|nr:HAD family phosphatase [Candidatus Delongbacteria bacterium]